MALQRIVMHLARNPEAGIISGDSERGYALVVPLTADGLIDEAAWRDHKDACVVRAFAPGEALREGRLTRRGHNWFFDYERGETADDEPIFKLDRHTFKVGEYVTVKDDEDRPLVYRVDRIDPV
ncbi:MAG: hypothetical protein NW206_06570 [Hyphomonadaceae bacterium]|nr:hypothetical protein [Hyphomonadaceae bacterium]